MSSIDFDKAKSTSFLVEESLSGKKYGFKILKSALNHLVHILIGATVSAAVMFAFSFGIPLNSTLLHILLCVIGYQLLMAQSILSLSPNNGWSSFLKLRDKRRAHWILQILGSGLAIAGSIIEIQAKTVHFNTMHGKFALVALVFTTASLFNGLTSLYAYELRKRIPPNVSKITHILFGTVSFAAASVSLCYGFDTASFRNWATDLLTLTLIAFTGTFTFIIIVTPFVTLIGKFNKGHFELL